MIRKLLVTTLALSLCTTSYVFGIADVWDDYWAKEEILLSIQNGFMNFVENDKFEPENSISRSDFLTSLLKAANYQKNNIQNVAVFKDVDNSTPNSSTIIASKQAKTAFGYPDNTFKPSRPVTHSEAMSFIANITADNYKAIDITTFSDYKNIPLWALRPYIKNLAEGLYISQNDENKLNPNAPLTRAEAAVLFNKVANNNKKQKVESTQKDSFTKKSDITDDAIYNTLNIANFAKNNDVKVYNDKKIIKEGNVLIAVNKTNTKSKNVSIGETHTYIAPEDVYTKEGALLYPKGTEFYAKISGIKYSDWKSKPKKIGCVFYKYSLPNGETHSMAGIPLAKKIEEKKLADPIYQKKLLTDFDINGKNEKVYILITGDTTFPPNVTSDNV